MKNQKIIFAVVVVLLIIATGFYYFFATDLGFPYPITGATHSATSTSAQGAGSTASTHTTGSTSTSFAPSLQGVSLAVSPTSGAEPFVAKFVGTIPESLNGSYTFSMTFGDGLSEAVTPSCIGSVCTATIDHTYQIGGNFNPQFSAITKCAATIPVGTTCPHAAYVIARTPLTVTGDGATASLSITPSSGKTGEAEAILVKASGSSLKVDFGDGTNTDLPPMTAQSVTLEHVYANAGTYGVKVTNGTETLASQGVTVQSGT